MQCALLHVVCELIMFWRSWFWIIKTYLSVRLHGAEVVSELHIIHL